MDWFAHDLRFAFRTLWKSPVVTSVALASLAIGIGANTTIFTMINAIFFRGITVPDPDRVIVVFTNDPKQSGSPLGNLSPVSRPNFEDLRDRNEVFSGLSNILFAGASLSTSDGEPEMVGGQLVSGNYFDVLGVQPTLGRGFLPEEDETPGTHPVVVLSHTFWTNRFGADPDLIGRTITLNRQACTVIGVAPAGFNGTFVFGTPDFWAPTMMYEVFLTGTTRQWFEDRRALMGFVFGRLKTEITLDQARASMNVLGQNLALEYPVENEGRNFALLPLNQTAIPPQLRDNFIRAGGLLMTVVGLVLLIACVNVANLLLGKAAARRKEIAIRLSLGSDRGRLIRQLLTESVVLALLGGCLGLLVAVWGRSLLWSFRPPFLQDSPLALGFDPLVLVFTLVISILTGIIFGLVPALQVSRPQIVNDLKPQAEGARGASATIGLKNILVGGQVALSLVALIGSGLFLRSLGKAMEIDPGFETDTVAMMTLNLDSLGYEPERGEQFFTEAAERVGAIPGVKSATLTTNVPLWNGIGFLRTVLVEGRARDAENNGILTPVCTVGDRYFETLGIPIIAGRPIHSMDREGTPYAVVVNESMAKQFWPDEDALGKQFHFFGQDDRVREVVGIAKDSRYQTVGEEPRSYVYIPRMQDYQPSMNLVIRASGSPEPVMATVRTAVQQLDRNMPVTNVQTMSQVIQQGLWPARMGARLLGILGLLALLLASIGIYGVMSYAVNQRKREIGIRMALGARRAEVLQLFMRQGLILVTAGIAVGLVVAGLMSRAVASLLYDVSPTDFLTFTLTTLTLAVVALLASFVPSRRATSVDPVVVLRYE